MLEEAKTRGFVPEYVCFDSWYASLENLKAVRGHDWISRLAPNRLVSKDYSGNRPVSTVAIESTGTTVHLMGYGLIRVFKVDTPEGDIESWATNDLQMDELTRLKYTEEISIVQDFLSPSLLTQLIVIHSLDWITQITQIAQIKIHYRIGIPIALAVHSVDPTLQLFIPRKVMQFLQPLIVRYNDDRIALRQFQIGSRVIFKPARPDSDRNCNQSGSILDICLAKRGSYYGHKKGIKPMS